MERHIIIWQWTRLGWAQVACFVAENPKDGEAIPLLLVGEGDERHFVGIKPTEGGYPEIVNKITIWLLCGNR